MTTAKGIRAGAAYVELTTKNSGLVKGLQAAEAKLKAFGAGLTAAGAGLIGLGSSVLGPLGAAATVFSDMGGDMLDMSQRTGVAVEALSELRYAAEQSGTDVESLEGSLRKMQKAITSAAEGSDAAKDSLSRLGLSVEQLSRLSPDQQFALIGDRISKIADPTLRAAMAMELFGKSGTKMLPMFANGAAGLAELRKQAADLGLTMSTEDAQAAEAFGDAMDSLWKVLKQSVFVIGSALEPALSEAVVTMTKIAVSTLGWVKANKPLVVMVAKIAAGVVVAGAALIGLGAAVYVAGAALGAIAGTIGVVGTVIGAVGSAIAFLASPIGLAIAGVVALGGAFVYFSGAGGEAIKWLVDNFQWLKDRVSKTFQGISDAMAAGDMSLAAKVLWAGVKLSFLEGTNSLRTVWASFNADFVTSMTNSFFDIQAGWVGMAAGMLSTWEVFKTMRQLSGINCRR
jgi:hypothetical protein